MIPRDLLCLALGSTMVVGHASVLTEDFSDGMDRWWAEGGKKVWVEDGKLFIDTDVEPGQIGSGATVWLREPIEGNVKITATAHVVASKIKANNINFFLAYSMPNGSDLYTSRDSRADGAYKAYHQLDGYIVTFLNDRHAKEGTPARSRLRRCPGFTLMAENFSGTSDIGRSYRCEIIKNGGAIRFYVDGKLQVEAVDPEPLPGGYFGLRTFATLLWWDDIIITPLPANN